MPRRLRLSAEDGSWDVSAHLQTVSAKQPLAHPVFPFSLVSGGVYSPGELKRALATSHSLRAHYKNFDFKHVRLIRIQNNTPAFVSYRKDGKIFWTKRKLTLHAGELVLADGHYLVRARCANQISFVPQTPVDAIAERCGRPPGCSVGYFRAHADGLHAPARSRFAVASADGSGSAHNAFGQRPICPPALFRCCV